MNFLLWLWNLSAKTKLIVLGIVLTAAAVVYVGVLSHRARVAEQGRRAAEAETKRLQQRNEGLEILQNTNTVAGEIENEKKIAAQQSVNSNAAANDFNFSVNRDSGTFAGNRADSKSRFCRRFPEDSRCVR